MKVLIDKRDFLVGDYSVISMEKAVKCSRHTLAVLTPDWVESRWTAFESLLTTTANPLDRKLLPLMLQPCQPPDRIAAINYADFTEPSRREVEFAKLLRSIAVTAPPPQPVQGEPVRRGLVVLGDLMKEPGVREAVVTFRIHFQRVCDRIGVLGDYKDLHDLLHTLQLHCYDRILQEAKSFPDDDLAVDNLREHEATLQSTVEDLRRVGQRKSLPPSEVSWVQRDLEPALGELHAALENLEPKKLRRTTSLLNRVLTTRPSEINTRLNDAARDLPFLELIQAMTVVRDRMRTLDLDLEKVQQFETGIETLARLSDTLATLVADHDRWQEAEQELRLTEETWDGTIEGIEDSWASIHETLAPMAVGSTELWAASFRQDAQRMGDAVAAREPERARRCFRSFRRQASTRFHRVDVMLKDQCDELRKVAEPLASLLKRIES
ncbi:MAG TPA: toll/interleukin-1 receptor domain-containing protein [Thermoanaerobaculia bacterium]|nr:toll/interleukin-1 receptor domain-containing protein [Thermoanaerobaculia bacterium]